MEKTYIIQEIQRTAGENDGSPLGWRSFSTETGIVESDWKKYWPRWSEALVEAGFAANQMSGAYEEGELLDKLAGLAVELGRLPTYADMRFKARCDPPFPSNRPFGRLGRMGQIVEKLVRYCQDRPEYKDVLGWCEEYKPRTRDLPNESAAAPEPEMGFVYLMKSGRHYKLGKSNAVGRRERELAIQLPDKVKTVHVIRTDDPSGIEVYWHKRFEGKRRNGEWFELDAIDVAAFKRRKFM